MGTCAWPGKGKCGRITQADSIYCPRHTFLHNVAEKEAADREIAKSEEKRQRQNAAPKTREDLLRQGYEHINNAECHGCHKAIEWWKTPNARRAPYDPMKDLDSPAVSHFATCQRSADFRRVS